MKPVDVLIRFALHFPLWELNNFCKQWVYYLLLHRPGQHTWTGEKLAIIVLQELWHLWHPPGDILTLWHHIPQWRWLAFETMLSSGAYTQEWGTVILLDAWVLVISERCWINKLWLAETALPCLFHMSMHQWKQTHVLATVLNKAVRVLIRFPCYFLCWELNNIWKWVYTICFIC